MNEFKIVSKKGQHKTIKLDNSMAHHSSDMLRTSETNNSMMSVMSPKIEISDRLIGGSPNTRQSMNRVSGPYQSCMAGETTQNSSLLNNTCSELDTGMSSAPGCKAVSMEHEQANLSKRLCRFYIQFALHMVIPLYGLGILVF